MHSNMLVRKYMNFIISNVSRCMTVTNHPNVSDSGWKKKMSYTANGKDATMIQLLCSGSRKVVSAKRINVSSKNITNKKNVNAKCWIVYIPCCATWSCFTNNFRSFMYHLSQTKDISMQKSAKFIIIAPVVQNNRYNERIFIPIGVMIW